MSRMDILFCAAVEKTVDAAYFNSDNITDFIVCILGTVLIGAIGLIVNALIQRRRNLLEIITQNRLKKRDRIMSLFSGILEVTDKDLKKVIGENKDENTAIKKRLIQYCSELRSLLDFEYPIDYYLFTTTNELKTAVIDNKDADVIEQKREALAKLIDIYSTTDWNRIKEETTGSSFNRKHSKKYEKWKSNFKNNKDYYNNTLRDAKKDRIEFDKELK